MKSVASFKRELLINLVLLRLGKYIENEASKCVFL